MMNKFTIAAVIAVSVLAASEQEKYNKCLDGTGGRRSYCTDWIMSKDKTVDCTKWAEHPSCDRADGNDMDWDINWLIGNSAISTSATAALLTAVTLAVI